METGSILIGVDENGLGSRLGPMTVTGVRVRVDRAKLSDVKSVAKATAKAGIDDSKAACAHGDMAAVEAQVLAYMDVHCDKRPRSLREFTEAFSTENELSLRGLCPEGEAPKVCFDDEVPLPAFGGAVTEKELKVARALKAAGFVLEDVRVAAACAKRINVARDAGQSRMDVDLSAMLEVVRQLRIEGASIEAVLGKVGGRMRYGSALTVLSPLVATLQEVRERSTYRVPGVGTLSFVMDGDATEPAISLASMVGKYARELWMHRHNRYWMRAVEGVREVSGYHDPTTSKMIAATALTRKERGIPAQCFER